ncbi:hypothetical protein [[Phormidium] sp. ETS-05]|uniref:hypothetical protein n=1 Tax=[Phormidium] sp. ETS-05 TaxID=222819 RepID=UPI0018EEEA39|nr:hypothetical protein [[Phormidium] sp. ETS-05]
MTLANVPTHLKEEARQGDPKAIAATINHIIEPQGLTSQARVSNGSLLLLVESEEVPHAETIVPFLHAALVSLGIDGISNAKIGGRQRGGKTTSWQETVDLENPPDEIIDAAEHMSQDEYHSPEGDEDMPFDDDMPLDDDAEEDQDNDQYQEDDNDEDIADDEKPQKPKSKSQLPLVLLLLLVLLLALGGAAFFFLPSLRSYLPFLPQEGAETPPESTPNPATTPTATAPATPATPPTPAPTPTPATTPTATTPPTPAPTPTPAAAATPAPTPTPAAPATTTGQTSVELIQAVRKANQAWELTQQAQSVEDWQKIAQLWREASQEMAKVPPADSRYDIAQDRIGRYEAYALFADQMATIEGQ